MELELTLFTIEVYLDKNDHTTDFRVFAKNKEDAIKYVATYIDHYITSEYRLGMSYNVKIEEGRVLI